MQVQNMNLKLNMKDINKILAKALFKFFLNDAKKQHMFVETCLYEAVGSLPVMSSLLPQALFALSFLKAYSRHSRLIFFVYIKSCQYSMFYTNKMFWTRSQV